MTPGALKVVLGGISDIGVIRDENQDALLIHEPSEPEAYRRKGILVALADGMGGLEGGSVASRLAVDAVLKGYYNAGADPASALEAAVKDANRAIYRHSLTIEGGRQMGSTLTAVAIVGNRAFVAQVGDSRAYRYRSGSIHQVTRDHSLLRELIDRGEIDESAAHLNAHRNILTRGLGLRDDVSVDVYELEDVQAGDTLLLSSDGLHGLVHEDEMAACLERFGSNVKDACQELVRIARDRGGPDNITVALAHVLALGAPAEAEGRKGAGGLRLLGEGRGWMLPLLVFLSFAAGVLLTLYVEDASAPARKTLESVRKEAESALQPLKVPEDSSDRAERLEAKLKEIRRMADAALRETQAQVPEGGRRRE